MTNTPSAMPPLSSTYLIDLNDPIARIDPKDLFHLRRCEDRSVYFVYGP
jgi:hypothetical protein